MDGTTTVTAAAKRLGVTTRTVHRYIAAGTLKEVGRAGNAILLDAKKVEEMARQRNGGEATPAMSLQEAYVKLRDAKDENEREAVMDTIAGAICATAEDRGPLVTAWEAACSMAATRGDEAATVEWDGMAHKYGAWLGRSPEDTDKAISHKAQRGSFTTAESAEAEAKAAPRDPAYEIAAGLKSK